jgi:hypothetical protein
MGSDGIVSLVWCDTMDLPVYFLFGFSFHADEDDPVGRRTNYEMHQS